MDDYEVIQTSASDIQLIDATEKANVDTQVATAKQYPRDIKKSINNAIVMATMDNETAQACGYALPRGGKPITGPSVHLAKIIVSEWGNMRTEAKVVQITDKQIISRGVAWDLENNVASSFEVRRSITNSKGQRFNDDMITVTGNAANAIAYRNAVFSVIPKVLVDKVYKEARKQITGDLSDETVLLKRRTKAVNLFKDEYDISEEEVIKLCGKQTLNQIKADEIALLLGIYQSLNDGDTTVEDLMKPIRQSKEARVKKMEQALKDAEIIEGESVVNVDTKTGEIKEPAKKPKAKKDGELFNNETESSESLL